MDSSSSSAPKTAVLTLHDVDNRYEQIGCLGHGGFGSVFLARKRTYPFRHVAIKVLPLHDNEELRESYERELGAMMALNHRDSGADEQDQRDMNIVFLFGAVYHNRNISKINF